MSSPVANEAASPEAGATPASPQSPPQFVASSQRASEFATDDVVGGAPAPAETSEPLAASRADAVAPVSSGVIATLMTPFQECEQLLATLREIQTDLFNVFNNVPLGQPNTEALALLSARITRRPLHSMSFGPSAGDVFEISRWMRRTRYPGFEFMREICTCIADLTLLLHDSIHYLDWRQALHIASSPDNNVPEQCTPMWQALRALRKRFLTVCSMPAPPSGPTGAEQHIGLVSECVDILSDLTDLTGLQNPGPRVWSSPTPFTDEAFQEESREALGFANSLFVHVRFRYWIYWHTNAIGLLKDFEVRTSSSRA